MIVRTAGHQSWIAVPNWALVTKIAALQLSLRILVVANTLIWMAEAQYEGEAFGRSVPQDGPPDAAAHMAARHVP